ncbi:hypothetical protein [Mycobacterium sp.]|uniref:hypothetical protein n=1 Tax=Mycobacterium sp. TaxID=1785 RepID=UPI003F99FEA8
MTAAAPSPVLAMAFRGEAVMVLANMTMASLGGGGEQRGEDHQLAPRPALEQFLGSGAGPVGIISGAGGTRSAMSLPRC